MQMQMQIYTSTNNTTTLWRVKLWCNEIEMDQFLDGKNLVDDEDEEEDGGEPVIQPKNIKQDIVNTDNTQIPLDLNQEQ